MYPETTIRQFEETLSRALNDADHVFAHWGRVSTAERSTEALSLLFRMAHILSDAEDLPDFLSSAYPPVSLTADKNWRAEITDKKKHILSLVPASESNTEFKSQTQDLLYHLTQSKEHQDRLVTLVHQVIESEDVILKVLVDTYDSLLEIFVALDTTLSGDRAHQYALMYAQEKARYFKNEWRSGDKCGEESKLLNHIRHIHPFGYPPTSDQLQSLYRTEYEEFIQTPLGKLYDVNNEDTVGLAVDIAKSGCSSKELQEFFRVLHRLEKYVELAMNSTSPQSQSITINIDTFNNHSGATFNDNSRIDTHLQIKPHIK